MWKKIVSAVLIFSIFSLSVFAADNTPEKYDKSEIPQPLQDFRRFEIITLGSLPFVMLDTTLAYSAIMTISGKENAKGEAYKVTPFASNSCFTWEEDQKKIIGISAGICLGIGVADLVVRLIKRASKNKKAMRNANHDITITPVSEDPDATFIKLPESEHIADTDVIDTDTDVIEIIEDEAVEEILDFEFEVDGE